jgi:hypothetical protein
MRAINELDKHGKVTRTFEYDPRVDTAESVAERLGLKSYVDYDTVNAATRRRTNTIR